MKRILLTLMLILCISQVFSQAVSRATVFNYWKNRVVPTTPSLTSTWASFWNIVDDGLPLTPTTGWAVDGNSLAAYSKFLGTTNNRSLFFKTNTAGLFDSHYCKIDSFGYMTLVPDTNGLGTTDFVGFRLKGSYQNNAYMQLKCPNISAYRLLNSATNYEWFLQNQTFGGGLGTDAFAIGVTSNPSASFFQLSKRGESKTECYYNNNLIIGMQMDSAGHFSTGSTLPGAASFRMSQIHRGGATATGIFLQGSIATDVTTSFRAIFAQPTYSGAVSRGSYIGSTMGTPSMGSNTLTSLTYYDTGTELAAATVTGDTYGYFSRPNVVATRNVWGFFSNGTAPNFFRGPLGISSTTAAPAAGHSIHVTGISHFGVAAANTQTTISQCRIGGSSTSYLDIGDGATSGALYLWAHRAGSKTTSNYNIYADEFDMILNDSASIQFRHNNVQAMNLTNNKFSPTAADFCRLTPPSAVKSTLAEIRKFYVSSATTGFGAGGTLALNRTNWLEATTYTASSAATITKLEGLRVDAGIAGSGVTITDNLAIHSNGKLQVTGNMSVTSTSTVNGLKSITNGAGGLIVESSVNSSYSGIDFNTSTGAISGQFLMTGGTFVNSGLGANQFILYNGVSSGGIVAASSGANGFFRVMTGGIAPSNNRFFVSKDGNVGINTETGTASLTVIGTASITGTSTLNGVVNQSTLTVGNTNTLTGGNSGTIAVISDNIFAITFVGTQSNPADATVYYFGQTPYIWNAFGNANNRFRLPVDCQLTNYTIANLNVTTNGTNENTTFAVRVNDATDNTLSSTITFNASADFSGTNTQTYSAGDLINIKVTTPTWVTNPVGALTSVTLWFKRRS